MISRRQSTRRICKVALDPERRPTRDADYIPTISIYLPAVSVWEQPVEVGHGARGLRSGLASPMFTLVL